MRKISMLTAIAVVLTLTSTANASSDRDCGKVPPRDWLSKNALKSKASDLGYQVRRIKMEDGCFEVYAIDDKGARVELYLRPDTGELVRKKVDD